MKKKPVIILNFCMAFFFAVLFYKNYIGINLFIFELAAVIAMFLINKPVKLNLFSGVILVSVSLSAIMVVLLNTSWSVFINIIMIFTLSAVLSYQSSRSYLHTLIETFMRLFSSQVSIFIPWNNKQEIVVSKPKSSINISRLVYLIIIPLAVVILFLIIYASASSVFYRQFEEIFNAIAEFFQNIDLLFVVMIIFGIAVGNALFMKTWQIGFHKLDLSSTDILLRKKETFCSI